MTTRMHLRDESGQAVVEFTLVLPILLLILVALISFGQTYARQLQLTDSVRAAARVAVVEGSSATACTDALKMLQANLGADYARVVNPTCTIGGTVTSTAQPLTVILPDPHNPGHYLAPQNITTQAGHVTHTVVVSVSYPYSINLLFTHITGNMPISATQSYDTN